MFARMIQEASTMKHHSVQDESVGLLNDATGGASTPLVNAEHVPTGSSHGSQRR